MAMWEIEETAEFEQWFLALDDKAQAHVIKSVDKLAIFGPNLGRPDVDGVKDSHHSNMKELRVKHAGHRYRVLFAFDSRRVALVLIGGDKAGVNEKRFYKRIIAQADRLYDDHMSRLDKKGSA